MKFCTAINCMDGRVQLPVIKYLQKRFNVEYVDTITEGGPNLILSEGKNEILIQSIFDRVKISVEKHNSVGIAITGHYDCAKNPASESEQIRQIEKAIEVIKKQFGNMEIIGLWIDENWHVKELK